MRKQTLLDLPKMLSILRKATRQWKAPIVGTFAEGPNALFKVLISTMLSLRTKDTVTELAAGRLFARAQTPAAMLKLKKEEIEKLIFPVGFYPTKAKNILEACRLLIERHGGQVPEEMEALLALPGVGRKTANLTITVGHGKHGICVDTHVHRISHRWALVRTKNPDETEMALRAILPKRYWIEYNDLLVAFGQNLCVPVSPFCSKCPLFEYCPRVGVRTHR